MLEYIKIILKVAYYVIDVLLVMYILYYVITGLFAFKKNKKYIIRKYKAKYKIAVLIAARNEEKVIPNLLDSLNRQNYPKELYDVFVIPNNCTDNTKNVALEHNAKIIEVKEKVSSKGEVLRFAFDYMNNYYNKYDAYLVFDADNIVHPNFIRRMNDTLCSGYKVAQGFRDSKNPSDSWVSSSYSMFYLVQNFFFNRARMRMGWSSSINGTGFLVSKDVIDEYGFNTATITEDIEFAAQCALNNQRIAFVEDAITYDEQPVDFISSIKQRFRWSKGTIQCLKIYSPKLLKKFFSTKVPQQFDMSLFFLAPIVQVISTLIVLFILIYNIFDDQVSGFMRFLYNNKIISLMLGYAVTALISLFVVIFEKKKIKDTIKGILTLSIFMLTWVPINIVCLFKKNYNWSPIVHNRVVNIDSIVEVNNEKP